MYLSGFFCTNTSLYRKLFFCNRDDFSSAQDFKRKREVNSFKEEQLILLLILHYVHYIHRILMYVQLE